ncbi:aspartate kinase [Alicyclobacillus tolerans]|uniref:aspartate kinase n=1 Tax=Alicyclobacillus tolerans TaxID=90970 RepID=UPI001F00778C|nr:aspartate kinase [Alicyclobacillus tolerans]MCF8564813.1 aspartate kinase [Alicyclobacillus tolerans]
MRILVQKFGGTSVATHQARLSAVEHVEDALAKEYSVVVVVSAMGRRGEPYATDTLLGVVDDSGSVAKRDLDILMSCGEAISAVVFASLLRSRGHEVTVLNGMQAGIRTTAQYGEARILEINPARLLDELNAGKVVVVMGFQGGTQDGDITTLGRGGSDTTATALGVALNAEYVDIFTDVEGIMTADPRIVSDARRLHHVTYTEICNLAYQGAKVIHPRAVEIAMQKNIPIRVRSTTSKGEGTLVTHAVTAMEVNALHDQFVTGVTQTPNVTQINLELGAASHQNVFSAMAEHEISVDFISIAPDRVAYTVPNKDAGRAVEILEQMGHSPRLVSDCAKVAAVGAGIAGVPGIMAKIVDALSQEGIQILQSADSHTTIWCLVRQHDMEGAVRALHRVFNLAN